MPHSLAVLITYHNEGELFQRCLESLFEQSNAPDEVWVYDDASAKNAKAFLSNFMTVKLLRGEERIGPAKARNKLLHSTQCDYIHFHDADDIFLPNWTVQIRKTLEDKLPDAIFTGVRETKSPKEMQELQELERERDLLRFMIHHAIVTSAQVFRRELIEKLGGFDENIWRCEDQDLMLRVANTSPNFCVLAEPLIERQQTGRSRNEVETWNSVINILKNISPTVPAQYHQHIAETIVIRSSRLYQLGDHPGAEKGFQAALAVHPSPYSKKPLGYSALAHVAGPLWAERISSLYRKLIPETLRKLQQS